LYSISKNESLSVGDSVLINEKCAADGYYSFIKDDTLKGFNIANGKVSSIEKKSSLPTILIIVIVFITFVHYHPNFFKKSRFSW